MIPARGRLTTLGSIIMSEPEKLIPPPPVVRTRLAKNLKERRILRALLRLSVRAIEETGPDEKPEGRHVGEVPGVAP
jgi:hypothetical protein